MDLLKHVAPKKFLKCGVWPTSASPAPHRAAASAVWAPAEPLEATVDRYEANLPSIHKLICHNRQLRAHHQAAMHHAQAQHTGALKSFRYRALGALPLGTLALEMNELSQAGLTSEHASGVTLLSGTAAAVLVCMSVVALRTAGLAQRRAAVWSVRQDELQGALDREARAAARTSYALRDLRRQVRTQSPLSPRRSADKTAARHPAFEPHNPKNTPGRAAAGSDPQPAPPRPIPMGSDTSAGTTYHTPRPRR